MALTVSLTKSLNFSPLTRSLTAGSGNVGQRAGEALADAVISDLDGWGVNPVYSEREAIRDFYNTAVSSSYWSKIKCLWFPIFGASGPCAIEFKTAGNIGTFFNSWIFGSQGATPSVGAYFDTGNSFATWGLNTGDGSIVTLTAATTDYGMFGGVWDIASERILLGTSNVPRLFYLNANDDQADDGTGGRVSIGADKRAGGCFIGNRRGTGRQLYERKDAGFTVLQDWSSPSVGSDPGFNFYFGGYNSGSGVADNNTSDYLGFGLTEGLTQGEAEGLSLAMYTFIADYGLGGILP